MIQLTECPRDAMQGIHDFIPTHEKINYIKAIIDCGFPVVDAGSFVSPKAIPQMADSSDVFKALGQTPAGVELLAIVANLRGAEDAARHDNIAYLGYPFSVSETFQLRNTNATIDASLLRVEELIRLCEKEQRKLMVYLSMAFGNPYGDDWSAELVTLWAKRLSGMGVKHIALADTTGVSNTEKITHLFSTLIPELTGVQVSAHLHALPQAVYEKTQAAYAAGCRNFDAALKGFGGCPMASDSLTGNMDTEEIIGWCRKNDVDYKLNDLALMKASAIATELFSKYQ